MWKRLVHSAQFAQLLAQPQRWRSAHFALHHAPVRPLMPARRPSGSSPEKLSTTVDEQVAPAVDDSVDPIGRWWATVIPKRHARRAVTRNLIDRQVLAALQRAQEFLPAGQWLLRLRSPLPRAQFPSADSQALRSALRHELDTLLARCRSPKVS